MAENGIEDKQIVSVQVGGNRGLIFHNVLIRTSKSASSTMHIDQEEGNAAGLSSGDTVTVVL